MRLRFYFITLVFSFVCAFSAVSAEENFDEILKQLDPYIPYAMSEWHTPGCAIVIVKDGKVAYQKTFGTKKQGTNDPVDQHTIFPIASVSKNFTMFIVAQLVDEGLLHWNDPIVKYLPEFALADLEATKSLTIQDCLSHRVGLPLFSGDSLGQLQWKSEEIIKVLPQIPLVARPGTKYAYQNIFYGLVGVIIERVTGKDLAKVYQERIFDPLGMKDTNIGPIDREISWWQRIKNLFTKRPNIRIEKNYVWLHDREHANPNAKPFSYNSYLYALPATSGINSSIHDLGRWLVFWLNGATINGKATLKPDTLKHIMSPHIEVPVSEKGGLQFPNNRVTTNSYAIGWFVHNYLTARTFTQMGGQNGCRSLLTLLPDHKIGIIILSNLGAMKVSYFPESVCRHFLDLLLGAPDKIEWASRDSAIMHNARQQHLDRLTQDRLSAPKPPDADLSAYEGVYENPLYGKIRISHKKGRLYLTYRDLPPVKLTHWNANLFTFKAYKLSHGLTSTEIGEVTFGFEGMKVGLLICNFFYEEPSQIFRKLPHSSE